MLDTLLELENLDDRACVIVGVSCLDHLLERFLKSQFRPLDKQDERRMFDARQNGILGNLGAKIRLCYAMRLTSDAANADFMLMADLRNTFAHSLHRMDFTNAAVAEDCGRLRLLRIAYDGDLVFDGRHRKPFPATPKRVLCRTLLGCLLLIYAGPPEPISSETFDWHFGSIARTCCFDD